MSFFNHSRENRRSKSFQEKRDVNPYAILGLAPDAGFREVTAMYQQISMQNHRGPNDQEFQLQLNQAFELAKKKKGSVEGDVFTPSFRGEESSSNKKNFLTRSSSREQHQNASAYIEAARANKRVSLGDLETALKQGRISRDQYMACFNEVEERNLAALEVKLNGLSRKARLQEITKFAKAGLISSATERSLKSPWR